MMCFNKGVHRIPAEYGMDMFLDSMNDRLDIIAKRTKVNEFSGNNINSIKSIMLQLVQSDALTKVNKKIICLDILIAVEELT
jgi:hypothetical protein